VIVGAPLGLRYGGDGPSLDPVPLALERIRGHRNTPPSVGLVEGPPVHVHPDAVQVGQAFQHLLPVSPPRSKRGHPGAGRVAEITPAEAEQGRRRADLDEGVDALRAERLHTGGEQHRLAQVATPVAGACQLLRGGEPAGQVGDEPDARGHAIGTGHRRGELVEHGVHQRRMKRVGDR
jgi:hypothetical protein